MNYRESCRGDFSCHDAIRVGRVGPASPEKSEITDGLLTETEVRKMLLISKRSNHSSDPMLALTDWQSSCSPTRRPHQGVHEAA